MIKIYTLSDPRTGEIRYVGKTNQSLNKRLAQHIYTAKNNKGHSYSTNWINTFLGENLIPIIELIDEVEEKDWEFYECYWIEQFRQWGFRLTNLTKGGRGAEKYTAIPEYLKKERALFSKIKIRAIHQTGLKFEFTSLIEVSQFTHICVDTIKSLCKNGSKYKKSGYRFEYIVETQNEDMIDISWAEAMQYNSLVI